MPVIRLLAVGAACLFLTAGARKVTDPITPQRVGGATDSHLHQHRQADVRPGETGATCAAWCSRRSKHTPLAGRGAGARSRSGAQGRRRRRRAAQRRRTACGASRWTVPAEAGGRRVHAQGHLPLDGHAPAERKFDVRAYRAPRLKSQIEFLRDGYGPGDKVTATLGREARRGRRARGREGDGHRARRRRRGGARAGARSTTKGLCTVQLRAAGAASSAARARWPSPSRTAAWWRRRRRRSPSCCRRWTWRSTPRAASWWPGSPTRVYFEARTPAQKPADLAGVVVDRPTARRWRRCAPSTRGAAASSSPRRRA